MGSADFPAGIVWPMDEIDGSTQPPSYRRMELSIAIGMRTVDKVPTNNGNYYAYGN